MIDKTKIERVVVTGIGIVHSLGQGIIPYWNNLLKGCSGIERVTRFKPDLFPSQIGSEVKDFNPRQYMNPKDIRRNDRYTQLALAATRLAIDDSDIDISNTNRDRTGALIASGIGGMETIENQSRILFKYGPNKVSPFMIPSLINNIASGVVAIEFGLRGPNFGVVSACASSTHAIGQAMKLIQSGDADVMIVGGSEAAITTLGYAGFCKMKAMSTNFNKNPQAASRPFDKNRDGFVMGEGAGIIVLETEKHALNRSAKNIYCELAGYASTCDAYHITSPDVKGKGLSECLSKMLSKAQIRTEQVNYINAHGTSTHYNDRFETKSIKKVFGRHAYKLKISSTKSMTGHLLGAAGVIEAAVAIKTIQTGEIPPTINQNTQDPDCDLDYTPNVKCKMDVKIAISHNLGFGGQNASLLFKYFIK